MISVKETFVALISQHPFQFVGAVLGGLLVVTWPWRESMTVARLRRSFSLGFVAIKSSLERTSSTEDVFHSRDPCTLEK